LHLVRVSQRQSARQPVLADIRDTVLAEWRDQRRRETREQAYRRLRERYDIVMEADVETPSASADAQAPDKADAIAAAPDAPADNTTEQRP
jgi:hypothetical protein